MKRPNRSDGFTVVDKETPICLPVNNDDEGKLVCKKRLGCLQTLLDNLGEEEDDILHDGDGGCGSLVLGEKKRRLRLDQVKALEKNFEVDNKLEPERKVKLAEELGLQPRQVAVWFQNRRARWKTKQLERDYGVLKAEYESLKLDHEALRSNNEALLARIKEMKTKVEDGSSSVKERTLQLVKNEMSMKTTEEKEMAVTENDVEGEEGERSLPALKYKDGSSDSDTSAILNDDGSGGISSSSPTGVMSNPPHHLHHHHPDQQQLLQMCFIGNDCTSSSPFAFLEDSDRDIRGNNYLCNSLSEKQMLTVEEQIGHDFPNDGGGGGGGGGNSIFSDEQVPTHPWYYCSDHWKWN